MSLGEVCLAEVILVLAKDGLQSIVSSYKMIKETEDHLVRRQG